MTIEVAQISNTNTFQYVFNRVNELANAMSNYTVTTNSNTAVGNAAISGTFTANVVTSLAVVVANTTSNVTINVPNSEMIANGNYYLNAGGSWAPIVIPVSNSNIQTTGTVSQEIDSYPMATYGGVEYFIRVKNNNANGYQASKVLTFHNMITAFSTEYGIMVSNNTLGTFAVTTNATHVQLFMTPVPSSTNVSISRVTF
jgi:hypothetical protein